LCLQIQFKSEFGQAHCIEWFKGIHTKFIFAFFRVVFHFLEILEGCNNFWKYHENEKNKKNRCTVLGCTVAHGLGALAWPSGEFSWTGPCQPAWCGARSAVTAPAMRKAVHPPIARRQPARGVLSSSSIIEGWPTRWAKPREKGRSRKSGRREAVGTHRRGWRSWRNPTWKALKVREWELLEPCYQPRGGGHGGRRCGTHDGGESTTAVSSGVVHREGEKLKLPSLACSPAMRFGW
jgi:hypothetical protein